MKNIVLSTLLVIGTTPAFAQTSVGIIAGYHRASIRPDRIETIDISSYSGWRAGIITDHHLSGKFYLQPQLLLNTKGYNATYYDKDNVAYQMDHARSQLMYLELQTNLLFKQQAGTGKVFAGAGPYLGRGISGNRQYDWVDQDGRTIIRDYQIKYRAKEPDATIGVVYLRPYDAGINFLAGYELKNGLFFNAVYSLGLTRVFHGHVPNDADKNTYFGLSVGYFLKRFS